MRNDVIPLLSNLGWMEDVNMSCVSYDWAIIEFLCSYWAELNRVQGILISFHMFNTYCKMNLKEFNGLLRLPIHQDSVRDVLSRWRPDPV